MRRNRRSLRLQLTSAAGMLSLIGMLCIEGGLMTAQAKHVAQATSLQAIEAAPTPLAQNADAPSNTSLRAFKSLGLGRKRTDWESENGQSSNDGQWKVYKGGIFRVLFVNDRIWHLRRHWNAQQAPRLAQVRTTVRERLPDDLQLISSSTMSERLLVETYHSASLSEQFGSGVKWPGNRRAGTFVVLYHLNPELPTGTVVTLLEIKTGNNLLVDNH